MSYDDIQTLVRENTRLREKLYDIKLMVEELTNHLDDASFAVDEAVGILQAMETT